MSETKPDASYLLKESDQFWNTSDLDADRVESIVDTRARALARAALQAHRGEVPSD